MNCHGFNLKKFISNSEKVLQSLPQSTLNQKYVNLEFSSPTSERALGLIWNIQKDTFTFKPIIKYYPDTKRGILSLMSSIFVHIKLVGNLSTYNVMLALRRFISRRGHPRNIFSDNGTNFTGAQRELAKSLKSLDQDKIEVELTHQKINWDFSPPVSPWMNGAMEAKVKITKKHLNTITRNHLFNEETLHTYLE